MDTTSLGDRMKLYEGVEAQRALFPLLPVLARLDGRAFHSFCRGMEKPYDRKFRELMTIAARHIMETTEPLIAFVQSDEMSFLWQQEDFKSEPMFGGRVQKWTSTLAAAATLEFNRALASLFPDKVKFRPMFDCRVWNVPNMEEAANYFVRREQDAARNSIQAAGQAHFSHRQLHQKSCDNIQEMLFKEKGINWNDYPVWAKRGTWIRKRRVVTPFTAAELARLPPKHEAHKNPELAIERWVIQDIYLPRLTYLRNRKEVLFCGDEPQFIENKRRGEDQP